ncbi:MAG: META domain-containing protein [Dehalococcoidia bacterium]|nr:META domain-containing protein [Dehalococcoidia bacterium]
MSKSPILALLLTLTLIQSMAGCATAAIKADDGQKKLAELSGLAGTSWVLDRYGDLVALTAVLDGTRITLRWNENADAVRGNASCNTYGGAASIQGALITIGGIYHTEMASINPEVMAQEAVYLALLSQVRSWDVVGDILTTTCVGGEVLVYNRDNNISAVPLANLASTNWKLDSFGAGEVVSSVIIGTSITLFFSEDTARVSGMCGVNGYSGECYIDDAEIKVSGIICTMMFSDDPPGLWSQENNFIDLLGKAESFRVFNHTLTIYCQNGAFLVFTVV